MPIKSLNTLFRGGAKPDDSGPSYKRYSKDTSKRGSFQIAQPVTAPLTPPLSPFYPGFPGGSEDPPAHHASHSPCVTISGPLPDDVFAMIVSQQQQPQMRKQHRHSYSLGSSRATPTDQPQLSSLLPSRSSSLAPSLASLTSSLSTSPSVSGPATPTSDAPNPLAGRGMDKFHRQGSCATVTHNVIDAQSGASSRPRNVRAGSRESMTNRGVSWGTKRSVSDRTLYLETGDKEVADETRSLVGDLTEAFGAPSRAPKNLEFRSSGIPLRSTPNAITMSRSLSAGTFIRISPLSSPHRPSSFQSLRPPPAATSTKKKSAKPAALSLSPSKDRNQARNLGFERSLLSPPLSAVGRSPGRGQGDHDIPSSWSSGTRGSTGEPSSDRRVPVRLPESGNSNNNNRREGFPRRTSWGSDEPTSPNRTHSRDSRRCTFGGGRSLVTPVNNTTTTTITSARLSNTVDAVSPRANIQHPLTPPPDIPLPPVPMTTRPPRPMSSTIPVPAHGSLSISRTTTTTGGGGSSSSGARPALTSRHSAASRLPTMKYRRSSPELGTQEGSGQQLVGGGSRGGRRPPTPWTKEENWGHHPRHHPHHRSPELAQFGGMDFPSSTSPLLTEEPSLFACPSTAGAPPHMMPLSPSFDALGAMLDSAGDQGRDSLLLNMEPPWLDSPALPSLPSPRIPASTREAEGHSGLTTARRGAGTIRGQGPRARTDCLPSAPPPPPTSTEMHRTRSSGLEGIKLLIAQVDDWSRVNGPQQDHGGVGSMQDPFNARATGGLGAACCGTGVGDKEEGEGHVVWGCAF